MLAAVVLVAARSGCGGKPADNPWLDRLSRDIKAAPDSPQPYAARGLAFLELAEYEKALADFQRAVEREGNNPLYHVLCARACIGLGKPEVALARTLQAKVFNPRLDLQDIYWVRGQAFAALGQEAAASAAFDTAVGINPDRPEPRLRRGEFRMKLQHYAEALKDASRMIALDSNSAAGYNLRGRIYLVSARYDSAFNDLEKACRLAPDNPRYSFDLGRAYYDRQNRTSARTLLNQALKHKDHLSAVEIQGINELLQKLDAR